MSSPTQPRSKPRSAHSLRTQRPARKARATTKFTAPLPNDMADHGGHILGLDGLRALAVGAVVLYHVFPSVFQGGFLGVDLFFVISGFLITTLLLREDRRNNFIDLKGFWKRRIRRLIPALVALILVVVPLAGAVNSDLLVGMRRQVLGALTFSTNWLEIINGSDYFDQTSPILFKNFWSLAIEEQFYLLWPLIFLVLLVVAGTWWKRAMVAGVLAVASAVLMAVLYNGDNLTRLYYGTDTHLFGLAIGIALAFIWSDSEAKLLGSAHWRTYSGAYGWAGVVVIVLAMFFMPDQGPWAYIGGMFGVSLLAGVVIASMLKPGSIMSQIGETRVPHWIGTRSYAIYLWHWPIIVIGAALVPATVGSGPYWIRSIVAVVLTGLVAEASFRWVETPIRKNGFRATLASVREAVAHGAGPRIRWARAGLGLVAVLLVLTLVALIAAPSKSATTAQIESAQAEIDEQEGEAKPTLSPDLDPTLPKNEEITAIGDSIIVASKTGLEAAMPGMNFVATSNLKWSEAPGVVQKALEENRIGRVVILDFGTNAGVRESQDVRAVLDLLGDNRMIVLVNLYSPSTFIESSNEALAEVAADYPNVALADWNGVVAENPALLQVDETHPSIEGANAFGELAKESIVDLSAKLMAESGQHTPSAPASSPEPKER